MATFELKLPDIGEGVTEGEIVKWLVKVGDLIQEDQGLVEVMTDKATVTVPSTRGGKVVKTHGLEGDIAKVHQPLVTLELEAGAATSTPAPPAAATRTEPASAPAAAAKPAAAAVAAANQKVFATPVTRRMAKEHGIDLTEIPGSGPQGRVTKADVLAVMEHGASNGHGGSNGVASARASLAPSAPLHSSAEDQRVPLRGLRKRIAEKMVKSKFTAPHFTFVEEFDGTELVALRGRLNHSLSQSKEGLKLSFLPFIVKAVVATLRQYPNLNANMDEATQELVVRGAYNIGIAVATDDGLTVAVLKNADRLSLRQLSEEISRLGHAARERKLKPEELSGGTFTITSLGQTGGLFATPIINHPEVGILGVHRMRKRPVVLDDEIAIREIANLSLSFDHRVIDGSVGAEFTYALIRYLEHPERLFLDLA